MRFLLIFLLWVSVAWADVTIDGYDYTSAEMLEFDGITGSPSASTTGKARVYFDTTSGKLQCSQDGGAYADCVGGSASISDGAYGVLWNGDTTTAPSRNAVYDKIETLGSSNITINTTSPMTGAGTGTTFNLGVDQSKMTLSSIGGAVTDAQVPDNITITESDPKVGTLTNTKWCDTDGSIINCTQNAPVSNVTINTTSPVTGAGSGSTFTLGVDETKLTLSNIGGAVTDSQVPDNITITETDPQVGTLTNTKYCTTDGSVINCTTDAPSGSGTVNSGGADLVAIYDTAGTAVSASAILSDNGTNIGIGTVGPRAKLEVVGGVRSTSVTDGTASLSSGSLTSVKLGSLTSNGFVKTGSGDGTLSVDTSTYLTSESDPQVGTLTNTKWCNTDGTQVNCQQDAPGGSPGGSSPQLQFNNASSFDGVAGSGADTNGNIGIGTTGPTQKLQVSGTVLATAFSGPLTGNVTGNASTSTALAANGGNCSGNNFALGVDASGVGECAQPAFSNLSGSATDAQIPNTITVDLATTVTTNANLTGPITSVGNATSIASQTGTGTKFVVDNTPTILTPVLTGPVGIGTTLASPITGLSIMAGNVGVGTWNARNTLDVIGNIVASSTIGASNFSGTSSGTNTGDQTSVTGNAGTVTINDAASDTTTWPALAGSQTGNQAPVTDAGLTYNASTDTLTTTTFVGALTGTASGNLVSGGALGTPSSGTLTNATGLPVAGITSSTTTALGVGSLELGHASDTTIARSGAGAITVEGTAVLLSGGALGTPSSGTATNLSGSSNITQAGGWTDGGTNVYNTATTDNVGIGTTTPSTTFEIVKQGTQVPLMVSSVWNGDGDYLTVMSSGNIGIGTPVSNSSLEVLKSGSNDLVHITSTSTKDGDFMIITSSGNIGIGTNSPIAGLTVMNGNMGIGTWSPTALLQVNGTNKSTTITDGTTTLSAGVLTGTLDAGGATSLEIPNGASPTVDATGEIAVDTTTDQLIYYGSASKRVIVPKYLRCIGLSDATNVSGNNYPVFIAPAAVTIVADGCRVEGTSATIDFEDNSDTAIEGTAETCGTGATITWDETISGGTATLTKGEVLEMDVDASSAATRIIACVLYTVDAD